MLEQLAILADPNDTIVSVGPPPEQRGLSLPVIAFHCPLSVPQLAAWRMKPLAAQAETIHAWSATAALAAKALAWRLDMPAILSWPCLPRKKDIRFLVGLVDKSAFHITVPTEVARAVLLWTDINSHAVHLLAPAVEPRDSADLAARRLRLREALNIDERQTLLVAPGEIRQQAGHKYASWVHAIIRQILPDVLLLIPGDGPARERARYFAGTTGYDDEVLFSSDYPAELAHTTGRSDALAAADVALFLAERDTGIMALAQSMCVGKPIAASNTPDIAECAPNNSSALLSATGDPRAASANVLRLMEDSELASELAVTAQIRARKHFAPDVCKAQLAKVHSAVAS